MSKPKPPLFQKRHYEVFAALLRQYYGQITTVQVMKLFKDDNPKFNEDRFVKVIQHQ